MTFNDNLKELIKILDIENKKTMDISLNRVIEILNSIDNLSDLKREKELIIKIVIDSVENMETGNLILTFIDNYTKR